MATVLSDNTTREEFMVTGQSQPTTSTTPIVMDGVIGDLVDWFKLLADETRLRIVYILWHEYELNVRTLCGRLGQSQPAVSHHLALLRTAGMIECRRDGKHNFYHLMPQRFHEINDLLERMAPDGKEHVELPTETSTPPTADPS